MAALAAILVSALASAALPVPLQASFLDRLFAPGKDLWTRWTAHDPAAKTVLDHGAWDRLLKTYLVTDGRGATRFAYAQVTPADRTALDAYLQVLQATPVSRLARGEQFAFWVNLYNARVVGLVLEHRPIETVWDIDLSPGLFADGPWDAKLIRVEGEAVSLNDIEHRILRPIWNDPRIHYAVNCAAVGCPSLQAAAFTGANAERLLEAGARAFVNGGRGVWLQDGRLHASSIYNWFRDDFGGSAAGVLAHLRRYATPELAAVLARADGIAGYAYDWTLNAAERR